MAVILSIFALAFCFSACDGEDEGVTGPHVHSAVKVEAKEATCFAEGNYEYWYCSGCSMLFSDEALTTETTAEAQRLPKEGHIPKEDDKDCTTAILCSVCDAVTTEAKAAHTPEADDGDCTTAIKCSACDTVITEARPAHVNENDDTACDNCSCYLIYTAEDLYAWRELWPLPNAMLMNDIVLPTELVLDLNGDGVNESNWRPVLLKDATFDGDGHSITGLTVINSDTTNSIGFFSSADEGSIVKDLHLVDVNIVGYTRVGGCAGDNYGLIVGCSVSGSIRATGNDAGGIAGFCGSSGLIIGCFNEASVYATKGNAAGICGQVYANQGIIACYNTGTVTSDTSGIAGSVYKGSLIGCYSVGESNGSEPFGITGYIASSEGKVIGCYFGIEEGREESEYRDFVKYSGSIKLVDGETLSWADVLTEINAALGEADATFRYEINNGDDKATRPLVLVPIF